jgi:mutator family transposase
MADNSEGRNAPHDAKATHDFHPLIFQPHNVRCGAHPGLNGAEKLGFRSASAERPGRRRRRPGLHDLSPRHWIKISSTDPLERLIGEVKRRTDVVGIFPNAIVRLVGALLLEQNDEWAVGRRYMSLETLAPFGHTEPVRLPAVAA